MGLLSKSLKKTGQTRAEKPDTTESGGDKPSVGWLGRTFSERSRALTDKIDLESQYARLEALTQEPVAAPHKQSLRDRAKRFLSGLSSPSASISPEAAPAAERPKMSLRQRAALLMRKIGGGGGDGNTGTSEGPAQDPQESANHSDADASPADDAIPEVNFFPWHALSEDGALQSHIAFGEEPHPEHFADEPVAAPPEVKSPLSEFADTMERITENLKNLHVQLDGGNFIRDVQVDRGLPQASNASAAAPIISHHVPIEPQSAAMGQTTTGAGISVRGQLSTGAGNIAPSALPEKAQDIFWPRNLPLDLPARDIKLNADGSVSVVPGPFQLPYLAEDIAPPDSDLSHFTRNLKNAELFIAEGELQLTKIIYERLLAKINDEEVKRKIQANLDALDNYKASHDWGNFMPVPPALQQPPWSGRNPWLDVPPPRANVSEMPIEAQNITINMDKGFFEIAKAIFELKKTIEDKKGDADGAEDEGHPGEIAEDAEGDEGDEGERRSGADRRQGGIDPRGEGAEDRRSGAGRREGEADGGAAGATEDELRRGEDRRQSGEDSRGEGAEERRRGEDRRSKEAAADNSPPPSLAPDGEAAAMPDAEAASAQAEDMPEGLMEPPKIPDMSPDGQAMAPNADGEGGSGEEKEEENKVQEIRGVLELKTPDQEDTPFLTLTYDFTKIPHSYRLAKDNGIFEYAYYKYKPMLVKAHQFIKRKQITRALNYYRVIREQQIPTEFRHMVDRNIKDITEYLQKYLVTRAS